MSCPEEEPFESRRLSTAILVAKVRDTGPGIDPVIRDRIFQPFATAGKADGLGLGLALSRQAVLDHGGQMWLESASQGACFAFGLPSSGNSAETSPPEAVGQALRTFQDAPDRWSS